MVSVEIFSLNGDLTQTIKTELFDNTGTIDELEWDRTNSNGSRTKEGIYISKIILQVGKVERWLPRSGDLGH